MTTPSWTSVMPRDWHTMRSEPASGPTNMAVDMALLTSASTRAFGVWRTYAWETPTISFGRNERVRTRFNDESIAAAGLTAVRRPTGGRALLHANEVTYSVTMPLDPRLPWTAAYASVNAVLLAALRSLGIAADLAGVIPADFNPADGGPSTTLGDQSLCFASPAAGEIVVDGIKLAGSAVWRARGAYLQHGSILFTDDQARLTEAMLTGGEAPPAAATLRGLLSPTPSWSVIADAFEQALMRFVTASPDGSLRDGALTVSREDISAHEVQFCDPSWLWRR